MYQNLNHLPSYDRRLAVIAAQCWRYLFAPAHTFQLSLEPLK
jgi:hypothetical protein